MSSDPIEVLRRAADELRRADALARKSDKIDRRKVIGRAADNNLSVILSAIASLSAPKPRMVGCEGDDGLIRTHPEAETCDVCAPKPEGEWVLVPREPTPKMVGAWTMTAGSFTDAYAAMLAAAPQPPAEAQPVAVPTVIVQQGTRVALVEGKPGYERIRCYWELPEGAELFLRPPPSAPVGVEGLPPDVQEIVRKDDAAWALAERAEAAGAKRDSDDDGTWWMLRIEQFKTLAQPTTPGSDKAMKWHTWRLTRLRDQLRNGLRPDELKAFEAALAALAQQPAAVGGECAIAAIQFALNDPEGMTFLRLWNEGEFEALRREWPEAPSSIYTGADALAAQQGGES